MIWALIRLWRRLRARDVCETHCATGLHRDTVELTGGYMLQLRCLDCGRREWQGWVIQNATNRRTWEHDDA